MTPAPVASSVGRGCLFETGTIGGGAAPGACNGDVDLQIAAMRLGRSATAPPRTNQTRSFQGKCLRKPRDTARIYEGDIDLWASG